MHKPNDWYFFTGQSNKKQFNYVVRIINPKRKSDVTTHTWHGVHEEFIFPSDPNRLNADFLTTVGNNR